MFAAQSASYRCIALFFSCSAFVSSLKTCISESRCNAIWT